MLLTLLKVTFFFAVVLAAALGVGAMTAAPVVQAQTKIGFVSTERILRDSKPAKAAQTKIEAEFKRRDEELERMANNLRSQAQKFDKDAKVLIVVDEKTPEIMRATNNLEKALLVRATYLSVYYILNADKIVMTPAAVKAVNAWLGGNK